MNQISRGGSRLLKFGMVGAIGIAVQLAVLGGLTAMRVNYLVATALAVEAAVLHNFLWHQRFTWADRGAGGQYAVKRLLRFHVSNGAISLMGNLLLMRIFVGWLGAPVIIANIATIALCALANFAASDRWVFETPAKCECES
jgi:putative flippase GtrA